MLSLIKQALAERKCVPEGGRVVPPSSRAPAAAAAIEVPAAREEPLPGPDVYSSAAEMRLSLPAPAARRALACAAHTVHCFDEAVPPHAEAALLALFYAAPWVQLKARRLQQYGGDVDAYNEDHPPHRPALPAALASLSKQLVEQGMFAPEHAPNHALVNEYGPGEGILPHTDGPRYHPRVVTLSLGAPATMLFVRRRRGGGADEPVAQLLLRRRSLVVFEGEAYADLLHAIPATEEETVGVPVPCANADSDDCGGAATADQGSGECERFPAGRRFARGTRVSVTLRHVPERAPTEAPAVTSVATHGEATGAGAALRGSDQEGPPGSSLRR